MIPFCIHDLHPHSHLLPHPTQKKLITLLRTVCRRNNRNVARLLSSFEEAAARKSGVVHEDGDTLADNTVLEKVCKFVSKNERLKR